MTAPTSWMEMVTANLVREGVNKHKARELAEHFYRHGIEMTKEEALKLIKLLSAVESWAFSTKTQLPDYLHEDLCLAVEKLEKIVLKDKP